jgi:uncharacterized protein (TIGR00290 family)
MLCANSWRPVSTRPHALLKQRIADEFKDNSLQFGSSPERRYRKLAIIIAASCGFGQTHRPRVNHSDTMLTTSRSPARPKALIAWSSGKDSAWALHEARRAGEFDIVGALTTVTDAFARVSMHGVREELLRAQLEAAGLAAITVRIPYPCPNEVYEREMAAAMQDAKARGVTHIIFGDLYLEDVRAYREKNLAGTGITPVFPVWGRPTGALAREMIAAGVEAHLVVVDLKKLPASFAGRRFDESLLAALPAGTDSCGENGEFHTFVSGGPMLARKIPVKAGATVERDGFAFADLMSA